MISIEVCILSLKFNSIFTKHQPTVLFNELFANVKVQVGGDAGFSLCGG